MTETEQLRRFCEALRLPRESDGVGTLSEKRLHAALKRCYAKDSTCTEVPVGRYVADVFDGERIVEVQTGNFARLLPKLRFFLERYPTTVVYPMPRTRYIVWTNPETGESTKPRKSPASKKPLDALHALYPIRTLLGAEMLTVEVLLFDLEEYRLLNGYARGGKKGSECLEKLPRGAPERIRLQSADDYRALLPENLPERFTAAQFGQCAGLKGKAAYSAVHVYETLGVFERDGNAGRATAYRQAENG